MFTKKRLSDRALMILRHIADRSEKGLKWLPGGNRVTADFDSPSGVFLNIGGAGDAAAIRGLVRAGLLVRDPPKNGYSSNQYEWLLASPEGRALLEKEVGRIETIRNRMESREKELARHAEE